MPTHPTTRQVAVAAPSRLRTDLNVAAAVLAVCLALTILTLLASTPAPKAHHHPRPAGRARPVFAR